jgi:hypothetical protein
MHILFITEHLIVHSFERVCSFVTVEPDVLKVIKIRIPVFWDVWKKGLHLKNHIAPHSRRLFSKSCLEGL